MKSYTVRNANGQAFEVDEDKIGDAEKDGYLPVVSNGAEEHRVAFADLPKAEVDGYKPKYNSDVNVLESGIMGAAKGASMGFAPAIAGALEAAGSTVGVRGLGGKFGDTRLETDEEDKQSLGDIYRGARDAKRKDYDESKEANPGVFTAGEVGGAIATSLSPGMGALNAAKGASAATVIGKGALQGGIYGLGDSEADLTKGEFKDAAFDVAKGAALGGAGAGAIHGAVKGAGYVSDKVANTKTWKGIEEWISTLPEKMQSKAREKAVEALNPILSQQERLETTGQLDKVGQELLDNNILQNKFGTPTNIKGIYQNLENKTDQVGREIGRYLQEAQDVEPGLRITSKELADAIKEKAVAPNIQTPFWKGANAVNAEAEEIAGWNKEWTLPELNQYKSELGKRIKTWGSDNLQDKKVFEDMYHAVNEVVESALQNRSGAAAVTSRLGAGHTLETAARELEGMTPQQLAELGPTYQKPLQDFKTSKATYGALEGAEKIAKKASAREAKNNDWGLTTWLSALTGSGIGTAGGPAGMLAGAAAGIALRQSGRGYGNQSAALLLNKLSKAPAALSKYAPVLEKYAAKGPEALSTAIYVIAKDNPEFQEWLKQNPPEPSQPGKLQAREEEAGLESEGFTDFLKPYKQVAVGKLKEGGHSNLGIAADFLLPDSPFEIRPGFSAKAPKASVVANTVKRGDIGKMTDKLAEEAPLFSRTAMHEGRQLMHVAFDDGGGDVTHMLYGERGPLAVINATKTIYRGAPTWAISHSASAASGQGLGKKLYELVADTHGEIVSDLSLSPKGSHKVYEKHFANKPGVETELGAWDTYDRHKITVKHPEEFRAGLGTSNVSDEATGAFKEMKAQSDPYPLPKNTSTLNLPEGVKPESALGVLISRMASEDPLTKAAAQRIYDSMPAHIRAAVDRALGNAPATPPKPKRKRGAS